MAIRRRGKSPWGPSLRWGDEAGFTLVELLVALLIFGMLSAAGVALLSFSVRAQDMARERMDTLAEVRRAGALLTADLAQAAPRLVRDEAGLVRPAFEGGSGQGDTVALALVRRGWENLDGAPRPSLQKVQYRLAAGRLERGAYRFLDGAEAMAPTVVADGIVALRLRYRDRDGLWRDRWDPTDRAELPRALEMVIETGQGAPVRQMFLVGANG
ncbi:MAG TPA: type II secretion system minor pseudopilin GspJ [Allosphingosinicella sp.]|nr:type II secretion system minor pseudopilin GspJ [Allosphingosinicella sp.]